MITVILLLNNLKVNFLIFSTNLNSSLIIFIRTYTVNYRNALDSLRVRMNIVLLRIILLSSGITTSDSAYCDTFLCLLFVHLAYIVKRI